MKEVLKNIPYWRVILKLCLRILRKKFRDLFLLNLLDYCIVSQLSFSYFGCFVLHNIWDTVAGWLQMFETEIGCISESNCEPVKQPAFSQGLLPQIRLEIIVSRCKMVTWSFRRLEFITGPFTLRLINHLPPQRMTEVSSVLQ